MERNGNIRQPRRFSMLITICAVALVAIALMWTLYLLKFGRIGPSGTEIIFSVNTGDQSREDARMTARETARIVRVRLSDKRSLVRVKPDNRISVTLDDEPSDEDVVSLQRRIENVGKIGFYLINSDEEDLQRASEGHQVPGHVPYIRSTGAKGQRIRFFRAEYAALTELNLEVDDWLGIGDEPRAALVETEPAVSGDSIDPTLVSVTKGQNNQEAALALGFTSSGSLKLGELTEKNIGRHMAFVIDDVIYTAPVIAARIGTIAVVEPSGGIDYQELEDLARILHSGEMPASLQLEEIVRPEKPE